MQKIRVGVFMGGMSAEKEVSFNSGRTVCDHLDTARFSIVPLFQTEQGLLYILPWRFLHRGKISDFEHRLLQEAQHLEWDELVEHVDFMYICVHGRYAEDGTLQGMFELLHIPYLGPKVLASALRADKYYHKNLLQQAAIKVARFVAVTPHEINEIEKSIEFIMQRMNECVIQFPCIVKPHQEGSSLGVRCVRTQEELIDALRFACTIYPYKQQLVLIEEKIEGMEFACIVITDYKTNNLVPLPPTEIVPEVGSDIFDYDQKYMPGRALKFTPARCSLAIQEKIQQVSIAVMQALNISNLIRVDGFVTTNNEIVIIDPNTISGMGPTSFLFKQAAAIGMNHTQFINHLIETELNSYGMLELSQEDTVMMENQKKIRVAVLFGGDSNEKEISLESGRNVLYKLSPYRYESSAIFITSSFKLYRINASLLVSNATAEIEALLTEDMAISWHQLKEIADFVFIALHGGLGENGSVQGALELLGLPYNGSGVLASALCMDKYKTTQFLKHAGFDVASSLLISKEEWFVNQELVLQKIIAIIPMPLIVKPHDDGCSVMVYKIHDIQQLLDALTVIFTHKNYAMIEEYIVGMELTVGVIGNHTVHALPPSQAKSQGEVLSIKEKFLPGAGENLTPAPLMARTLLFIKKTMQDVYKAVGCVGYARIDCFYQAPQESPTGQERVVILEINTLPGLTPATCIFHQAAEVGLKPMDFIDLIITLGIEQHTKTNILRAEESTMIMERYFVGQKEL